MESKPYFILLGWNMHRLNRSVVSGPPSLSSAASWVGKHGLQSPGSFGQSSKLQGTADLTYIGCSVQGVIKGIEYWIFEHIRNSTRTACYRCVPEQLPAVYQQNHILALVLPMNGLKTQLLQQTSFVGSTMGSPRFATKTTILCYAILILWVYTQSVTNYRTCLCQLALLLCCGFPVHLKATRARANCDTSSRAGPSFKSLSNVDVG